MSATRQSQQSLPSAESRSSSKASWAAKKSPALKSRTPAPKPGGKRSGATPATLHQHTVACAPPEGRSDRLADRPGAGLSHAVFVARGDLLGIDPVGVGQAPLEGA